MRALSFALMLALLTPPAFASPPPQTPTAAPTKEETISWMREKLVAYGTFSATRGGGITQTVKSVDLDSCKLTIKRTTTYTTLKRTLEESATVDLAFLDTALTRVIPASGSERIFIFRVAATNEKPTIAVTGTETNESKGAESFSESGAYLAIYITDQEVGERLSRALAHLTEACTGKREPF